VLWASYVYGVKGATASTAWSLAVLWVGVPGEWDVIDTTDTARLVAIPAVVIAVSATTAALAARERAQQEILRSQSTFLEEMLRDTRDRVRLIRTVLRSVDFTVIAFDARGKITVNNNEDRPRVTLADLSAQPTAGRVCERSPLQRALSGEEAEDELVTVRDPDGAARTFAVNVRQFGDERTTEGGVLVARDVTAEQEALAARDGLVASVSHELRTPITSIIGSIELARESDGLPPDVARLLDVSARNAERLIELVGGILNSARERRVDFVFARCDLVEIVDAAIESAVPRRPGSRRPGACRARQPRTRVGDRGRVPHASGARQPGEQRDQVQPRGRFRGDRARPVRRPRLDHRPRRRHRHLGRRPGTPLRALLPRGHGAALRRARHRTRSPNLPGHHRTARR
jgi:signal transduction histidine kinase